MKIVPNMKKIEIVKDNINQNENNLKNRKRHKKKNFKKWET